MYEFFLKISPKSIKSKTNSNKKKLKLKLIEIETR